MSLDPVAEALYRRLCQELPPHFVYHSAEAARQQAFVACELAAATGLTALHTQAVCWALLGRPLGWLADYCNGASVAPEALRACLDQLDAPPAPAELAVRLLREAHLPPRFDDSAAQVFADALAAEHASEFIYLRLANRRYEWNAYCPPRPLSDWYANLLDEIALTPYNTPAAQARYEAGRQARLAELRQLLGVGMNKS